MLPHQVLTIYHFSLATNTAREMKHDALSLNHAMYLQITLLSDGERRTFHAAVLMYQLFLQLL